MVLDLGDGIGALIVHTAPELLGEEIDISPSGTTRGGSTSRCCGDCSGPGRRPSSSTTTCPEGEYTLWRDGVATRGIQVTGGAVAEIDWGAELEWSGVS